MVDVVNNLPEHNKFLSGLIGRIYEETKQRPQYIIEKAININKLRNMSNDFESNKNEKLKERRVVLNTTKD